MDRPHMVLTRASGVVFAVLVGCAAALPVTVARAQTAPPEPAVKPELPDPSPFDADGDQIDDAIQGDVAAARGALGAAAPSQAADLQAFLNAPIRIELVFSRQITQAQLDAFVALGGQIDHVYQAVSYGWTGRLARSAVESLPGALGSSLVLVVEDRPAQLHLDEATLTGRVRPVLASGLGGGGGGVSGSRDLTLG